MSQELTFQVKMRVPYTEAVEQVTAALKDEGFGVLTTIDVKETLKKKLDEDFRPYVILGACNPPLAYRALSANPMVGVMLPCNVTVEQDGDGALVSIVNPDAMMSFGELGADDTICDVAAEARAKLERVAQSLAE